MGSDSGSNVLMFVAVVAVAFSLFGLIVTINKVGDINAFAVQLAPTEQGEANLTVLAAININFTVNAIEWGEGAVDTALGDFAVLDTDVGNTGGTADWLTPVTIPLNVSNIGNVDVNLTLSTDKDAAGFIGGNIVPPEYSWKLNDPSSGNTFCVGVSSPLNPAAYEPVNCTAGPGCAVASVLDSCSNFTIGGSLEIDVRIVIPSNSDPGLKTSTVTATASLPVN